MTKKLKVGIIGCGGIAKDKHLPSLSKQSNAEIVAFCDIVESNASSAKEKYGTLDSKIYSNYMDLIHDSEVEVVHVCTPNHLHAAISIAALEAGKHVMCEKPMAKTVSEAKLMLDAAKRTGKKLSIGYDTRFRADAQYLHKICRKGDLGEIYYAKAHAIRRRAVPTWGVFLDKEKQGGGPLIDIGSHALDLAMWMMDNYKPKTVLGTAFHKLSQKENSANMWGSWDPKKFTVEDSAFGMIIMQNGATIILESSWALNTLDIDEAKVTLCGTEGGADMKGGLRLNGENNNRLYVNNIELDSGGAPFNPGGTECCDLECAMWLDCILNDTEPVTTPNQALVVSQILEAIYESSKSGKAVYFE